MNRRGRAGRVRASARSVRLSLVALGVCVGLSGCSRLQQEADAAARAADGAVRANLEKTVASSGVDPARERARAAVSWLSGGGPTSREIVERGGARPVVVGVDGTTIRVDVYPLFESGSFFPPDQGESAFGVACRAYDVTGPVTVASVECPDGTPDAP